MPATGHLDAAADLTLDLGGRHRKTLVGAAYGHAERRGILRTKVAEDRRGNCLDVQRRPTCPGEVRDSEDTGNPFPHEVPFGRVVEDNFDPAHQRPDLAHADATRRRTQVVHEARDEPRPVLPLQRDFLIVDDERLHAIPATTGFSGQL